MDWSGCSGGGMRAKRSRAPRAAAAGAPEARGALSIRPGTARDIPTIVALIRGLADYERLRHECKATAAGVRRHGFGRRRYFETLICRRGGRPVGMALYFFTFSTFLAKPTLYLEDLFVLPEERGRGGGQGPARRAGAHRGASAAAAGSSGPCSTGTVRPSASTSGSAPGFAGEWILTRLTGAPLRSLARRG